MNNDEVMLTSSFDSIIKVTDLDDYLYQVDLLIQEGIKKKDVSIPLNAVSQIAKVFKIGGMVLAKFLYEVKHNWKDFGCEDDAETMLHEYTGYSMPVIDRYIEIWSIFANKEIPDEYEEMIMQRNIRDLVPVAKLITDGYRLNPTDWERIADAPNGQEIGGIARDIRGKPPKEGFILIVLEKSGELAAYDARGNRYRLGYLTTDIDNETVERAIRRIINRADVQRR